MESDSGGVPQQPLLAREVFTVGGALSRAFDIWSRNVAFFVGASLVIHLPLVFFPGFQSASRNQLEMTQLAGQLGVLYLQIVVQALLGFGVAGAFTYAVVEQLRGRAVDPGRTFSVGISKIVPLLGVTITTGLLVGLGALLCCVPGIVFWLWWILIAPVVVIEGKTGGEARARSKGLTEGHRWGILGLLLLLSIVSAVIGGGLGVLFGATDSIPRRLVVQVIFVAIVASFQAVVLAVTYYQLRSEKEGVDIDQLAAVFE
jgi:hypothetical protein